MVLEDSKFKSPFSVSAARSQPCGHGARGRSNSDGSEECSGDHLNLQRPGQRPRQRDGRGQEPPLCTSDLRARGAGARLDPLHQVRRPSHPHRVVDRRADHWPALECGLHFMERALTAAHPLAWPPS